MKAAAAAANVSSASDVTARAGATGAGATGTGATGTGATGAGSGRTRADTADVLGAAADFLGVLDLLGFAVGFALGVPGARVGTGVRSFAAPEASTAAPLRDRVLRLFPGSSADLITRAYVSVIRFSRSAN
jgi:hypothetical protein